MSQVLDSNLLPYVQVRLGGVNRHRWKPGQWVEWPDVQSAAQNTTNCILWVVLQGSVSVSQLNPSGAEIRRWEPTRGTAMLWPMNTPRKISTAEGAEWLSIGFHATAFDRVNVGEMLRPPRLLPCSEREWQFLRACAEELLVQCHGETLAAVDRETMRYANQIFAVANRDPVTDWTIQNLIRTLFGLCCQACAQDDSPETAAFPKQELPPWLWRVLEETEKQNLQKVAEMARSAGFSEAQFRRLFRQWVGVGPHQYLHDRRMQRARHLLEKSELSIHEISQDLGFASVSHFIQAFKADCGQTPGRYRQAYTRPVL